jgi:hypothetical protein
VREKKPVFCEKRTEIVDGVYVTTRGCSIDFRYTENRLKCVSLQILASF